MISEQLFGDLLGPQRGRSLGKVLGDGGGGLQVALDQFGGQHLGLHAQSERFDSLLGFLPGCRHR